MSNKYVNQPLNVSINTLLRAHQKKKKKGKKKKVFINKQEKWCCKETKWCLSPIKSSKSRMHDDQVEALGSFEGLSPHTVPQKMKSVFSLFFNSQWRFN